MRERHDEPRGRRRDRRPRPGRRAADRPPRPRQGLVPRPARRDRRDPGPGEARRAGRRATRGCWRSTSATSSASTGSSSPASAASSACGPTRGSCSSKSLRPPPEKFHGLEDVETRYRKRELDLIANAETRELFAKRAQTIAAVRRWFDERGFVEVETPVLQPLYGGALARPFTTHHNALDRDLYLRIATELYLKRLIVGGIDKVYELGKDFRNEGVSPQAQPRVHDARVVRGLRRLRGHRRASWSSWSPTSPRRCWGRPRSSARARRSTWRRPGGGSPCATRSRSAPEST